MSAENVNPFLDALPDSADLHSVTWNELAAAAGDPDHPWGLATMSTVTHIKTTAQPVPVSRILVLRRFALSDSTLLWHTDVRSAKVQQLEKNSQTSILFWHPIFRIQLAIIGCTEVIEQGKLFESEWENSSLTSRRAYLGELAPGSSCDEMDVNFPSEYSERPPTEEESSAGKENFVVLKTTIKQFNLLILRQAGNVRVEYTRDEANSWKSCWQSP